MQFYNKTEGDFYSKFIKSHNLHKIPIETRLRKRGNTVSCQGYLEVQNYIVGFI